jgi:membrane protease YdiL (CAAX protease family)
VIGRILELVWVAALLVGWPLSSLAVKKQLESGPVPRMSVYVSAALSEVLMAALTLAADLAGSHTGVQALRKMLPFSALLLWTLGTVATCVVAWAAMLAEARVRPRSSDRVVFEMLPRTRAERRAFFGVSLLAGLGEEYVVRGFCLGVIALLSGSLAAAYVVTTVAFGLGHLYQGRSGAMRAMVLGAILAVPVVATGSLLPSIIAHAATDIISGRWTLRFLGNRYTAERSSGE